MQRYVVWLVSMTDEHDKEYTPYHIRIWVLYSHLGYNGSIFNILSAIDKIKKVFIDWLALADLEGAWGADAPPPKIFKDYGSRGYIYMYIHWMKNTVSAKLKHCWNYMETWSLSFLYSFSNAETIV